MSGRIVAIIFDHTKFRHTPYTRHNAPIDRGNVTFYTYEDSSLPEGYNSVIAFGDDFEAATPATDEPCEMFVSLSGLKADPDLVFTVGKMKASFKASEYIVGYVEHMRRNAPRELIEKVKDDPKVLNEFEKKWSVDFFRKKLSGIVTGTSDFFTCLFRGIDNAMGDTQRTLIYSSYNSPHKSHLGSYDTNVPTTPKPDLSL